MKYFPVRAHFLVQAPDRATLQRRIENDAYGEVTGRRSQLADIALDDGNQQTNSGGTTAGPGGEREPQKKKGPLKTVLLILLLLALVQLGLGVLLLLVKEHSRAAVDSVPYTTYTSDRFQYSVCYDPALFTQQPSTAQGDVETFVSRDGHATFSVYGSHLGSWGIGQIFDADLSAFTEEDPDTLVTGRELAPMAYAITAKSVHTRMLERALVQDGVVKRLRIRYDKDSASTYQAAVDRMTACFSNTHKY